MSRSYQNEFKCPQCYVIFTEESTKEFPQYSQKLCDFCEKSRGIYPMPDHKLARRMLDILEKTLVSDYADIMKFIFSQVKFEGDS